MSLRPRPPRPALRWQGVGTTANPGRGQAAPQGRPCQATASPGSPRCPAFRDSRGGRGCPRAAPASASGAPRPAESFAACRAGCVRRDWADWPRRRPLSWLRFPEAADHPRGSYAREPRRPAAHEPQTWQSPSLRPLLAPSTKGSTSQRLRHVGLAPVPLWMWADRLWARAGWRRRSGGRCLRGSGLGEPLKGP